MNGRLRFGGGVIRECDDELSEGFATGVRRHLEKAFYSNILASIDSA